MASIVRITELNQNPLQVILSGQKHETISTDKEHKKEKDREKKVARDGPVRAVSCNISKTDQQHVWSVNPHQEHVCPQSQESQVEGCENREKCFRGTHRSQVSSAETPRKKIFYTPFSNNPERHLKKTISEPFISTKSKSEDSAKTRNCVEFLPKLDKNIGNSSSQTRSISRQQFFEADPTKNHNGKPQPENFFGLSTKQLSFGTPQSKQPDNFHSQKRTSSSPPIAAKFKVSNKSLSKPVKALPNCSLSLKSFDGSLPELSIKVPHRGLTSYNLPNLMSDTTTSSNPDLSMIGKQSKRASQPLQCSTAHWSSTDATNLVKCSKTHVLRQSLEEQLHHYQKEIDNTRWMSEQHLERVHRSWNHKPLRLVVISSKISQKQFLTDALLPNTVDVIYDYDNFSTSDLLDAIQKKLDGKKVECLLMMCKGGPGYMYLLRNNVVTPQKLKNSDWQGLNWFWKSLEKVISKLEADSAAVHILVPKLTDIQQGCILEHNLQQLLEPSKIHVEAVSFSNNQGLKVLSMYFNMNGLLPWLELQQQQQQQYVEEEEEEDIYEQDQDLQYFLNPDYDLKDQIL